jgi:DNA polymerase-4
MATNEAKPNGTCLVAANTEKHFIAPLSTRKLPGIGSKTYKKLAFMGVQLVKTLSEVPPRLLQREFGKYGTTLWKRANAIDSSPIIPYAEQKSISTERTFQEDTIDMVFLKSQITKMVMQLGFELRKQKKLTACITIKIRYTDFNTYTLQKRISHTASDQVLLGFALPLFDKLYQRRQLLRLVGVKFSNLVSGHYQASLFENTAQDLELLQAMDGIRKRFGNQAIMRASALKK